MFTRDQVWQRLTDTLSQGRPVVGAGAGTGISAKFAERGGADLILIYNSGRYRMGGHGSNAGLMPIGDANAIVMEMGEREVLPVVQDTPVIAGVNGTDPTRVMDHFLGQVEQLGFSGVINFPSVGYIDGRWRQSLEATGFGYHREAEMIRKASERGLFTLAYCYDPKEAPMMAEAGVDVMVAHLGLTTGGSIGADDSFTSSLDACVEQAIETRELSEAVNSDILVVLHGGPLESPEQVDMVMRASGCPGFIGASTMERLPTEVAIESTVRGFKNVSL
ncbi:MAG: phosphoenolpyruvate hydrolase family protein [bacterium]|nr:phosphoenolpyruvate hydrolase family protein [Acidimicrobiia bacterium]MCY4651174.1 phosphoenolpyruvate hydrolase family protein [bacterium]